jgi:hypothetical protein
MTTDATLEDVLELVRQLSPVDKARLIEHVMPDIERELVAGRPGPGLSLLGIAKDLGPAPSAEEIDEARREAWAIFPRCEQ